MCCVGKRFPPPNHLTMLCCHVAYLGEKKVLFVDRSGVVNSVLEVAFIGLWNEKKV